MKNLLLILSITAISIAGHAQSENDSISLKKHEIGVDATTLFSKLTSFGFGFAPVSSPYTLIYRYRFNEQFNLRAKLGGNHVNSDRFEGDSLTQYNKVSSISPAIGFEFNKMLHPKWSLYTGVDLTYSYTQTSSRYTGAGLNYINTYDSELHEFGGGPFLGIRFKINQFISLTTETQLLGNYTLSNFTNTVEYPATPSLDATTDYTSNGLELRLSPPIFIYLNISF